MRAEPDQSHPLGITCCARTAQVHKQTKTQGRKPPAAVPTIQQSATTGHDAGKQRSGLLIDMATFPLI